MPTAARHLVELKARYEDLGKARALLTGGERLGSYRQVDTYFSLGERRMKVRVIEGHADGELVYYERPDVGGIKESLVILAPLPDATAVLEILRRTFPVRTEVRKTREIYRYHGIQIHLDTVPRLGKFVEFEKVLADESGQEAAKAELEALRRYLQIPDEDLMASSYSDLLESRGRPPG